MALIYHIGAHNADNAGDIVLLAAMNELFKSVDMDIKRVLDYKPQPTFDAPVFVGGGGLFIKDTQPNTVSGWRWNISIDNLRAIQHPIIVYGVGFNKFRGQEEFSPIFSKHLRTLVEKASFFSIRERSGINRLRPYIGDLVDKVRWQPCPASFIGHLFDAKPQGGYTVFSPAMDRQHLRGDIRSIVPVLKKIPDLKIALHIKCDKDFLQWFNGGNVVDLRGQSAKKIMDFYSGAKQVIGMRLHSCLIPFGFGVPVIPLISHNKLSDWLDDIGHSEWGVELSKAHEIEGHLGKDQVDLNVRDNLFSITQQNLQEIKGIVDE